MIYIYTTIVDETTNHVINWLERNNAKYIRINSVDFHDLFGKLKPNESDIHWFWKWDFSTNVNLDLFFDKINNDSFKNAIIVENNRLFGLYFNLVENRVINHPKYITVDKLTQIKIANKCGLSTPKVIVTSQKNEVKPFFESNNRIVTKCLEANLRLNFDNVIFKAYTNLIDEKQFNQLPNCFFPSMFQEYIEHKYEVRVFYLDGEFYTYALLKSHECTIDIGEAFNNDSVQIVPYKMPIEIENKLMLFMKELNLQMGSIDMLYSNDGKYVFLEVNPSGQFLGYSSSCNYNLDRTVAEYLIKMSNEKN